MKAYKVNIYNVNELNKLEFIDNIVVEVGFQYAREFVTGKLIRIVSEDRIKYDSETYKKYGTVLVVKEEELDNLASLMEVMNYIDSYPTSKVSQVFFDMSEKHKSLKKVKTESRGN